MGGWVAQLEIGLEAIAASLQPMPIGVRLGPVIANGCDTAAIAATAAAARAARPAGDPRRIVMVGRLEALKDPATLLRAFAAAGPPPGWQLQVVGEGPERPRLEALARSLGLDPAAVLPGRHGAIAELLGQADLFAFSTTAAEGFGIALIEAMAAGLPVLASDVPACREVLGGGKAGLLLPAGDVAAWAEALRELCSDADQRARGSAAALEAARHYDSRAMASRWLGLLGS
jgi:glycosyltransferase involved in cell wall biosynthesis